MEKPLYGNHSLRNLTLQKRMLRNLTLRKRIKKNLKTKFNEQNIHNTKGQIDKGEDI